MSFVTDFLEHFDWDAARKTLAAATPDDVERALDAPLLGTDSLAALLSPAAAPYLEELARRAAALTDRRFGRVVQLYSPLYLSNECVNKCTYCGFSHDLKIPRITLTPEEVVENADVLHDEGFRHVLLVSGEHRRHVNMDYLEEIVRRLRDMFESIAIEIQPLPEDDYRRLVRAGVDGLALYQEIYDPEIYAQHHLAGPKKSWRRRLEFIEGGGRAGMRTLGIGALLGLAPWRLEAFLLALHGRYLTRRFWQSRIAVSFPRIRENAGEYEPDYPVSDADLVQMICAMRMALPDAELVMSTREPAPLRDNLLGLGITRTSAGSKTVPGGYSESQRADGEQFEIEDSRTPAQVAAEIEARGFEPVWKDFDRQFRAAG